MRIVDEKGRLFGKVNLFDAIIILFILLVIIFISANAFLPGKLYKTISDIPEYEYVQIDVLLPEELSWIKPHINPGDLWQGLFHGEPTAQILDVRETDEFGKDKRMLVRIKAFASKDKLGTLSFGKYTLRIGEIISFYTPKYIFRGYIVKVTMTGEKVNFKD